MEATGSDTTLLNQILDSDEGAPCGVCQGELHHQPHGTPCLMRRSPAPSTSPRGAAMTRRSNGNQSVIHWDLVMIQTPEYGGGEMYFDGG